MEVKKLTPEHLAVLKQRAQECIDNSIHSIAMSPYYLLSMVTELEEARTRTGLAKNEMPNV